MEYSLRKRRRNIKKKISYILRKHKITNDDLHELFHLYDELDEIETYLNRNSTDYTGSDY